MGVGAKAGEKVSFDRPSLHHPRRPFVFFSLFSLRIHSSFHEMRMNNNRVKHDGCRQEGVKALFSELASFANCPVEPSSALKDSSTRLAVKSVLKRVICVEIAGTIRNIESALSDGIGKRHIFAKHFESNTGNTCFSIVEFKDE